MDSNSGLIWMSICSAHYERRAGCGACDAGWWADPAELAADHDLFTNDYAAWYRQHNNGAEPDEKAWAIWRQLTR